MCVCVLCLHPYTGSQGPPRNQTEYGGEGQGQVTIMNVNTENVPTASFAASYSIRGYKWAVCLFARGKGIRLIMDQGLF